MKISVLMYLTVSLVFLFPLQSKANTLTFAYQGVINGLLGFPGGFDPSDPPEFQSFIGKNIHFEYTFEGDPLLNPDKFTFDPNNRGLYNLLSVTAILNGMTYSGQPGSIFVSDEVSNSFDDYIVIAETNISAISGPSIGGFQPLAIQLRFSSDPGLNPFNNDSLPVSPLDPSAFGNTEISLNFGDGTTFGNSTQRRALRAFRNVQFAQPIPEPSTMLLFGTGLAGLVAWRYRKSVKA